MHSLFVVALNHQATVPVLVIVMLLASGDSHFGWESAWQSMVGDSIKPWLVLGILFSLIYQCITLDATGILKGLATKTVQTFGSNHNVLFLMLFLFAAVLTVVTNNDITIIVLTPLMLEIQQNIPSLDVIPFLFMILFTANTLSMLLISGNPANIIVAQAADLGTTEYIKHMALCTISTALVLGVALYSSQRNHRHIHSRSGSMSSSLSSASDLQPALSPRVGRSWTEQVVAPKYAAFCALRLLLTRIVMAFADDLQSKCEWPLDFILILGIALGSFLIDFFVFDFQKWIQRKYGGNARGLTDFMARDGGDETKVIELPEVSDHPMERVSSKEDKCAYSENAGNVKIKQNDRGFVVLSTLWICK